ncbi:hypothetical protein ACJ41O_009948 [Fusarium nematophilum]
MNPPSGQQDVTPLKGSPISMRWFWEKKPKDEPRPDMPYLPADRPRPLTAHSYEPQSSSCPLLSRVPWEIRSEILLLAFGNDAAIHIELDYDHAMIPLKLPTESHAARNGFELDGRHHLRTEKLTPKEWRWWSCVCHHRRSTPFDGTEYSVEWEPWADRCKFGVGNLCGRRPGSVPLKCHVGAMGWLLSCRQAYKEGICILFSTNTLESMAKVEMLWKIHPFREQRPEHPPQSDRNAFLTLTRRLHAIFPNVQMLYISLQGDMYPPGRVYSRFGRSDFDDSVHRQVQQDILFPIDAMIRNFRSLRTCVIALPSSCYGVQKHRALRRGSAVAEERFSQPERIWRELTDPSALDGHWKTPSTLEGYWVQIGHRDLKRRSGLYPSPTQGNMDFLYKSCGSPW